ncbi:MAG: hypothetical protein BMS9Abin02_1876 [Anaerolineae bacterium]|nr:MAG: hypothetical protein BMS9Abin02_1876 [Anaerolineae bacterium]
MDENDDIKSEDLDLSRRKAPLPSSLQLKPLSVEKGGFWRRYFAYTIDWFILGIIYWFFSSFFGGEGASDWRDIMLSILGILIPAVYFVWPYSRGGQTIGKRILGLRVVSIDGSPLTWRKGISRTVGYIPSSLAFYIGFLWAIWDADKQAWQDKLAGTLVLRASFSSEKLPDYIEPAEARRRQKRWLLGLGIPTMLIIATGVIVYAVLIQSGLSEVSGMGAWPAAEALPEDVVDVDLSHLGLELSQVIDSREEGRWEDGQYDRGVLVLFESGGKDAVYIWALRYGDTSVAEGDFASLIGWTEQNCRSYTLRTVEGSGIVNCSYQDGYDRALRNQNWILNILALNGGGSNPENMIDQVLASISAHWEKSPEFDDADS